MIGIGNAISIGLRGAGGGFVGLLDLFPNAAAGYSLRLLRKDYSGGLVRVRAWDGLANQGEADVMAYRVSANEYVLDLNSTLENLDATAISRGLTTSDTLADLVSTGASDYDGLTSAWYDQSLSNDATQSTAARQPKIVDAGVLVTENGKPAVSFDGVNDYFAFTTPTTLSGEFFITTALNCDPVGTASTLLNNQTGFNDRVRLLSTGIIQTRISGSLYSYFSSFTPNIRNLLTIQRDSADSLAIYVNSSSKGAYTDGNDWTGILGYLGSNHAQSAGLFYNGNIQEFIAYNLDKSANRTAIETNINTFYSIYP
jgi:hypothetical protein